jgi:WD40 repeat protein
LIFISHSSRNNDKAIAIRDWLVAQGWGLAQIYLDLDSLHSGERWRHALNDIGANCEAVIACLSDDWLRSPECIREFNHAESGGKPIFPVIVEPITERIPSFITDLQFANIVDEKLRNEGFERLRQGLLTARIGPQYFPWPPRDQPNRSVYRGLQALEEQDAAILFGRDAAISRGLDELRRLRAGARERVRVILGASGAGKSSFLRAGLIARLKREDHHFLVLPVIRPERAALPGTVGLEASLAQAIGAPVDLAAGPHALIEIFETLRASAIQRLRRVTQAGSGIYQEKPPTIVVPIDQAEEIFNADNMEAARFLELLPGALTADDGALAIFTIRSDSYALMQSDKRLEAVPQHLFSLPPIAIGEFKELIEQPGLLARPPITVEPALTDTLLSELDTADALPLLAFALERLHRRFGDQGQLRFEHYKNELGGLQGAIQLAVEEAVKTVGGSPEAPKSRDEILALLRKVFIPWLVRIDGVSGIASRRVADVGSLPPAIQPLLRQLVDARILTTDATTIEISHETILRRWPPLQEWIAEKRENLVRLDGVERAASEWNASGRTTEFLVHAGGRLSAAEFLLKSDVDGSRLDATAKHYLEACRDAQDRREEQARQMLVLREATLRERRHIADRALRAAQEGDHCLAALLAIEALELSGGENEETSTLVSNAPTALRLAVDGMRNGRFLPLSPTWQSVTLNPSGRLALEIDGTSIATLWDAGAKIPNNSFALGSGDDRVHDASFAGSTDIAVACESGVAKIFDATDGRLKLTMTGHTGAVTSVTARADRVVTTSADGTCRIWDFASGKEVAKLPLRLKAPHQRPLRAILPGFDTETKVLRHDASTPQPRQIELGTDWRLKVKLSCGGGHLLVAQYDDDLRLFDVQSGALVATLSGFYEPTACFTGDGESVVAPGYSPSILSVLDVAGRKKATFPIENLWRFFVGSDRIVTIERREGDELEKAQFRCRVWAYPALSLVADTTADFWKGYSAASIDRSGSTVALYADQAPANAMLWHLDRPKDPEWIPIHQEGAEIVFGAEDRFAVVGAGDDTVEIRTRKGTYTLFKLRHDGECSVEGLNLSKVAIGLVCRVQKSRTGVVVTTAAFDSAGARVLTAATDRTFRVWDANTGQELHRFPIKAWPREVNFSPKGNLVLVLDYEGNLEVYDAYSGAAVQVAQRQGDIWWATIDDAEETLLTLERIDGNFYCQIYDGLLSVPRLINVAKVLLPRVLARDERNALQLRPDVPAWYVTYRKPPYDDVMPRAAKSYGEFSSAVRSNLEERCREALDGIFKGLDVTSSRDLSTLAALVVDWIVGLIPSPDHFKNNDEYELASAVFANVYNQLRNLGHESAARMLLEATRGRAAYPLPQLTKAEEGLPNA